MHTESRIQATALIALAVFLLSCTAPHQTESPVEETARAQATQLLKVSWIANREQAVNSVGGGYRVYYSQVPDFAIVSTPFADVPYVTGATAPTTTTLAGLPPGNYYIRVAAYSQLNQQGGAPSAEISGSVAAAVSPGLGGRQ